MPKNGLGAIVERAGAPIQVEPIEIDDPGPGEVLVRMAASGVCHSDVWAIEHGNWGAPWPMMLGHEGAGVVDAIGEGVGSVAPGDRVVLTWAVPCGRCRQCLRGAPRRCGHELHQPPRVHRASDDEVLTGVLQCGTLATHTVVTEPQVVAMPDELALSRACLLGCGVSTGIGAAVQTAKVWPGATVAVIGLGGIGLAALQGARVAGAQRLITIDVVPAKLEWAVGFGATDTVDASAGDPVEAVRALTGGEGVDVAFEAVGRPECVRQAVEMLGFAGTAVAIGVPPVPSELTLPWNGSDRAAYPNKANLLITDGGDPIPSEDFPEMARWAIDGSIDLDRMVTREISLTENDLTEAIRAMLAGEVIRSVVVFPGVDPRGVPAVQA
ncbi:MAG: alcohol dehydrogenase catalytic domain-containing protein [Actinobacteria bacterium]|nr:alcohol dehydrogenase catalytic domain-containing protein [Actinomycetota bacterium]